MKTVWKSLEDKKSLTPDRDQTFFSYQLHIPTPRGMFLEQCLGQVFWLVDPPTHHAFPSHSTGIVARSVAFVPTHSGGSATAFDRLPYTQAFAYLGHFIP